MRKTVLAFGEVLWDLLPSGPALGGAPFNFVYRVNTLGDRGLMVSRLGRDELGDRAWRRMKALCMDGRFIQWDPDRPTGTVPVDLSDPNRPQFTITPDVAYDRIELTDEILQAAARADCLCYGTLIQRSETSRRTLYALLEGAEGAVKLLDINLRRDCYTRETIVASLREADVLKLNDEEACELAGMFGIAAPGLPGFCEEMIGRWGLTHCLVTLGERGVFAADRELRKVHVPGYAVEVADSCGSGDAWTAGFVHCHLRGRPLAECCELGNALGALVATRDGATDEVPPQRVEAFLGLDHQRVPEPELEPYAV